MRAEALLEQLGKEGRLEGSGRFGLDVAGAQRKFEAFQLPDPDDYLLPAVAALVRSGSKRIAFRSTPWWLTITWLAGRPLYEASPGGLHFTGEDLGQSLMHALGRGLGVELDGLRLGSGLAIASGRHRPEGRLVLSRTRPGCWRELERIRERCRYCPAGTELVLNGEPVNPPLELGLCAGYTVVLGRMPENQYPQVGPVQAGWVRWCCTERPFSLVFTAGNWFRSSADPCVLDRYGSAAGFVVDGVLHSAPLDLFPSIRLPNYRLLIYVSGLPLDLSRQVRRSPQGLWEAVLELLDYDEVERYVARWSWVRSRARKERAPKSLWPAVASEEWLIRCGLAGHGPPLWVASPAWLAACGLRCPRRRLPSPEPTPWRTPRPLARLRLAEERLASREPAVRTPCGHHHSGCSRIQSFQESGGA